MRKDGRGHDQLRPVSIERGMQYHADGSVLLKLGRTHVLCGVSIEEQVPPFLEGKGQGWITAEYAMLPCATKGRYRREVAGRSGRTYEIQRLIGRSLRMMVDLTTIGERTLRVDCDVLNADGGTRTAAITGGALAVRDALQKLVADGRLAAMPVLEPVAAISAGIVAGTACLDLEYSEDATAEADGNFVMDSQGRWIEVQTTAEGGAMTDDELQRVMSLARKGIGELLLLWEEAVVAGG